MIESFPEQDWDSLSATEKLDVLMPIDPEMEKRSLLPSRRGKSFIEDYFESDARLRKVFGATKPNGVTDHETGEHYIYDPNDGSWRKQDIELT